MVALVLRLRRGNAFTIRPRATPPPRMRADYILREGLSREWCDKAKVAEEHRVVLVFYDNPKEFFGYINEHKPCAPLGPMSSSDRHLVTDDEEMAREFNNY